MKSVLVTGGAGFIGSHTCERLLSEKKFSRVICVDNFDPTYPVIYKKENIFNLLKNKKFHFYKADIRDKKALIKIFKKEKPDFIVHLAAKTDTRTSLKEIFDYESVNITGTLNMLEMAKDFGVKRFIFTSSSSIYGNSIVAPPLNEEVVTDFPLAPYGATKKAGEVFAYTYFVNYGLSTFCMRLFNVYGERMRPGPVLSTWVENILQDKPIKMSGKGQRKRDFTYVGDVVDAILKMLNSGDGYEIFNIANSKPVSLIELLKVVEKIVGKKAEVIEVPSNKSSIDISHADTKKANKILKWKPQISIEKGVSNYISWFRKNRLKNIR